jgi:hypothetical protein
MTKKRQIKGFWWSPHHPEIRCCGELTLDAEEGATLEIFFERTNAMAGISARNTVLHGAGGNGNPITLLFVDSPETTLAGFITRRSFWAGYVLIGIHVANVNSFAPNLVRFRMQQLYGWSGLSGFLSDPGSALKETVIKYRHPEDLTFTVGADLTVELGMCSWIKNSGQDQSVKEDTWISFRSQSGLPLKKCRDLMVVVKHLLHFASVEPVYAISLEARVKGHGNKAGDRWFDKEIEIWSSSLRDPKTLPPVPHEWIFRFEDIRSDFVGFMQVWLNYVEKYDEALDCYSSTIYHRLPDTMAHLALTQGLDVYHGERFNSHKKKDFEPKIRQLVSLHAKSLGIDTKDIADFSKRVQVTRNYYTHHNPYWKSTGKVAEKTDLFRMNEKLTLLFQMCVLTDIGIKPERFGLLKRQIATFVTDFF